MYNRYIRNDNGVYTRIPQEDGPARPAEGTGQSRQDSAPRWEAVPEDHSAAAQSGQPRGADPAASAFFRQQASSHHGGHRENRWSDSLSGFLRNILDQLHLDHVDTGDLLLLGLLFFLFREDADEELLVALGLLLIL